MLTHATMIEMNHEMIQTGLPDAKRSEKVVKLFLERLDAENTEFCAEKKHADPMYPFFYVPPYNHGKKLKTTLGQTPKTQIFSANMYELEILRLLKLLAQENEKVNWMVAQTLERLGATCFGAQDDGVGECFDTSLVVLRFLAVAAPEDTGWMKSRIDNYNRHVNDKKRPWFCSWYFWLCLSELPFAVAQDETWKYRETILDWLCRKSLVMNSENDRVIHPVLFCILRNIMEKYPEYAHIKGRLPYVDKKDGRLHFDMEK